VHSLLLGMQHDGVRVPRPLAEAAAWMGCFDVVQLNEDEMRQLSPDPLSLAADAIGQGVSLLVVTLAAKGAAYVAAPGFDGFSAERPSAGDTASVRSALVAAPSIEVLDPTGCGDVFGAAAAARLFAGDSVDDALRHANAMAARNAAFRGAVGLSHHLRGKLVTP
jgi:sugar/nucleoside kinase (ribokinase family)